MMNHSNISMNSPSAVAALKAIFAGLILIASGSVTVLAAQESQDNMNQQKPSASHNGETRLLPSRAIPESEDQLNQLVIRDTVDGLVLSVTIDGTMISLDSAVLARVPRSKAMNRREPGDDRVMATGLANGVIVSSVVVPDNVLNASEEDGLVRTTRRQIVLVLPSEQPIDTVKVEAPSTNASATLNVRSAYDSICKSDDENNWCPKR